MGTTDNMCTCDKCGKRMQESQFYTLRSGKKTELCKKCLTMHMNAFDESTFLWAIQKMDMPYIPEEWNVLRDRDYQQKGAAAFSTAAVFGKYVAKMKLKKWQNYTWADSEHLQAEKAEAAQKQQQQKAEIDEFYKQQYESGNISEAEYKTMTSVPAQRESDLANPAAMNPYLGPDNPFNETLFMDENDLPDTSANLTKEDKIYLAMKWGRLYKPDEWLELERNYEEMMRSFDIHDADSNNTLLLICKTNLKMNQALDANDIEGFQKLSKVSESLRKTGKFTAAQNKEDKSDCVDSIGELVRLCERQGFIPRYVTDVPQDKVDQNIQDQQRYIYNLVTKDLGFGQQIDEALRKIQVQRKLEEEEKERADRLGEAYDPYADLLQPISMEAAYQQGGMSASEFFDKAATAEDEMYKRKVELDHQKYMELKAAIDEKRGEQ